MKYRMRKRIAFLLSILLMFVIAAGQIESEAKDTLRVTGNPHLLETKRLGVDVSELNGVIDWAAMRRAGVSFAFIRVGGRYYGSGTMYGDEEFDRNMQGAIDNGIEVGVYFFSQAISTNEAMYEAKYVLDRCAAYDMTLPIVIDYEFAGNGEQGRLWRSHFTPEKGTAYVNAFMDYVEMYGYTGMLYANADMLKNYLYPEQISANHKIWLAEWTSKSLPSYSGDYDFWQFTDSGLGSYYGAESSGLDLNYWFDDGSLPRNTFHRIFDYDYFVAHNPDVIKTIGTSYKPAVSMYFMQVGMSKGLRGSAEFDPKSYYNEYPDLREVYKEDYGQYYLHYLNIGFYEGRHGAGCETLKGTEPVYNGVNYEDVFDYKYYLENNADVKKFVGMDSDALLKHFVEHGMKEGRQASEDFNVLSYKNEYGELRAKYGNDLTAYYMDYIESGKAAGRHGTGCEAKIKSPITVYNGVDYSAEYNYYDYMANYLDVKLNYSDDDYGALKHYAEVGKKAGRLGIGSLSTKQAAPKLSEVNEQGLVKATEKNTLGEEHASPEDTTEAAKTETESEEIKDPEASSETTEGTQESSGEQE